MRCWEVGHESIEKCGVFRCCPNAFMEIESQFTFADLGANGGTTGPQIGTLVPKTLVPHRGASYAHALDSLLTGKLQLFTLVG